MNMNHDPNEASSRGGRADETVRVDSFINGRPRALLGREPRLALQEGPPRTAGHFRGELA
jgi:hypothetical protein